MNNSISIKMKGKYCIEIVEYLKEFNEDRHYNTDLKIQVYREFKETILRTALRASANFYPDKDLTFKLPKSQAMLCFMTFNFKYYDSIGFIELCHQIETKMIKKGNFIYKL